jgi:serine/threonine protein kinase
MTLAAGTKLGPYEIQAAIGAGGMGEVYRARDTRLDRTVAIKVLPDSFARDEDRLRRFQQEARTVAALNHPNILALFDVGTHEGSPYLVSELLEGHTLRERLMDGPIPARKAVELLAQVAEGLAAAHDHGVIHRDLKPENIFVTRDARVKILDFGLAKLARVETGAAVGEGVTAMAATATTPGVVLGTVGYMSPEQVRGREVDGRSDIFAFGAIAYEMISGRRAFGGESSVETMNAILKEDPPELETERLHVSPGLERILQHCLEKEPAHRFQSARDLAFNISALSNLSGSSAAQALRGPLIKVTRNQWLITAAVVLVAAAIATIATMSLMREPRLDFQQLTFRRGNVFTARFAPDKKTVLYSAQWGAEPDEIFSTVADSRESRSLGLGNAELLATSSTGELAVLLRPTIVMAGFVRVGTLARLSMVAGTAPREVAEDITGADWSPDGANLAVIRRTVAPDRPNGFHFSIEYPIGKEIYKAAPAGWISHMRISPKGDAIAFVDHPAGGDDRGRVMIIGLDGKPRLTGEEFPGTQGLAWTPKGNLWFTGVPDEGVSSRELFELSPSGKQRLLLIAPGELTVHDINADGLALVTINNRTRAIVALANGKETNLEWLDRSVFVRLTADASTILFHEGGKAGGSLGQIYLRKLDGSPALKLSDGYATQISRDKKWVVGLITTNPPQLRLIPTGAGQPTAITPPQLDHPVLVGFAADDKHLLWNGNNADGKPQTVQTGLDGGNPKPYTPPGITVLDAATSDCCEVRANADGVFLWRRATGSTEPLKPVPNTQVIGTSDDMETLYLADRSGGTVKLWTMDRRSGAKKPLGELVPHDPTGLMGINAISASADGKTIVYGLTREVSELYLAKPTK